MDLIKSGSYTDILCAKTHATTKISTVAGYHVVLITLLLAILTQRAYIGNGENSCFIQQQIHWAETRDVI